MVLNILFLQKNAQNCSFEFSIYVSYVWCLLVLKASIASLYLHCYFSFPELIIMISEKKIIQASPKPGTQLLLRQKTLYRLIVVEKT